MHMVTRAKKNNVVHPRPNCNNISDEELMPGEVQKSTSQTENWKGQIRVKWNIMEQQGAETQ